MIPNITSALKEQRPNDMVLIIFKEINSAIIKPKCTTNSSTEYGDAIIVNYDVTKDKVFCIPIHLFKTIREENDTIIERGGIEVDNREYKAHYERIYNHIKQSKYGSMIINYENDYGYHTRQFVKREIIKHFNIDTNVYFNTKLFDANFINNFNMQQHIDKYKNIDLSSR